MDDNFGIYSKSVKGYDKRSYGKIIYKIILFQSWLLYVCDNIILMSVCVLTMLQPLLKKNGKALLAVSSLVNTYCKNARCENDMDIANVVSTLEDKIGYGCYVDDNNKENVICK